MDNAPKIVLLGGGTGSYELLLGLKTLTPNLTAVVNMCDDGGSTGRLRRDYGVLPPGDVRQCLTALSRKPEIAQLFSYRFDAGELTGHPVGNLLLAALEREQGDFQAAIDIASRLLDTSGRVLPVTLTNHQLVMQDGDAVIRGQEAVRLHKIMNRQAVKLSLEPAAHLNPEAAQAIARADWVIIAPGGLYWTLLPMFAVNGVPEALQTTPARVICVADLMNRPEQHLGWHIADYVQAMEEYLSTEVIDTVLYNTQPIAPDMLERYAAGGEEPADVSPARFSELRAEAIGAQLVADIPAAQDPADTGVARTLIRHDSAKTAAALQQLFSR